MCAGLPSPARGAHHGRRQRRCRPGGRGPARTQGIRAERQQIVGAVVSPSMLGVIPLLLLSSYPCDRPDRAI
eukprot:5671822-Pyramimonas_sp.AAC.1